MVVRLIDMGRAKDCERRRAKASVRMSRRDNWILLGRPSSIVDPNEFRDINVRVGVYILTAHILADQKRAADDRAATQSISSLCRC
jgi:hypothetical protein